MAPVGWLLDESWAPGVLVPTLILIDNATYGIDRGHPVMRYVTRRPLRNVNGNHDSRPAACRLVGQGGFHV
ncbi:MAG: Nucleoside hydrolase [Devosia sp.]|nr:Nucleoside hydrolase [Devosia sp.]